MEESIGLAPNPCTRTSVLAGRPNALVGLLSISGSSCTTTTTKVAPTSLSAFAIMRGLQNGPSDTA